MWAFIRSFTVYSIDVGFRRILYEKAFTGGLSIWGGGEGGKDNLEGWGYLSSAKKKDLFSSKFDILKIGKTCRKILSLYGNFVGGALA